MLAYERIESNFSNPLQPFGMVHISYLCDTFFLHLPISVRLHHNLVGFRVALSTDLTEALCHKCAVVEWIVVQLNFPSVASILFLVFDNIFLDNFDFLGFRWAVHNRRKQAGRRAEDDAPSS